MKCCICGKEIKDNESNNAQPLKNGRCCKDCNMKYVIPIRIIALKNYNNHSNHNQKC